MKDFVISDSGVHALESDTRVDATLGDLIRRCEQLAELIRQKYQPMAVVGITADIGEAHRHLMLARRRVRLEGKMGNEVTESNIAKEVGSGESGG